MSINKNYDLNEIKIVLEWAKQRIEVAKGSRFSDPERYEETWEVYNKVKKLLDDECSEWIKMNIG
jgi:hypothetical protein